jgi:membrane-associated protein
LPGDSLIFTAGTIAAMGALNVYVLFFLLGAAAILGDTVNYWIGHYIGPKVFKKDYKFLNKEYLERTHKFFEKHGGKTIIIARFLPIIRTFAPFLAGVGRMSYFKFLIYNIIGAIAWVGLFLWSGYFFGNVPFVKENFTFVILAIIVISLIPAGIEFIKYMHSRKNIK